MRCAQAGAASQDAPSQLPKARWINPHGAVSFMLHGFMGEQRAIIQGAPCGPSSTLDASTSRPLPPGTGGPYRLKGALTKKTVVGDVSVKRFASGLNSALAKPDRID
jgi:hypothetical protein